MHKMLKLLVASDAGQDMVEYALLAAFISVVAVVTLRSLGPLVTAALRLHETVRAAAQG